MGREMCRGGGHEVIVADPPEATFLTRDSPSDSGLGGAAQGDHMHTVVRGLLEV
jgi:hypothetical protein